MHRDNYDTPDDNTNPNRPITKGNRFSRNLFLIVKELNQESRETCEINYLGNKEVLSRK